MLSANRLHPRPIAGGRRDDAPRSHHRLGDEGGDRVGAFVEDQRVELLREPLGKVVLRLAGQRVAPEMRRGQMPDVRERQVEVAMEVR